MNYQRLERVWKKGGLKREHELWVLKFIISFDSLLIHYNQQPITKRT
jgi:hypothetical protein